MSLQPRPLPSKPGAPATPRSFELALGKIGAALPAAELLLRQRAGEAFAGVCASGMELLEDIKVEV